MPSFSHNTIDREPRSDRIDPSSQECVPAASGRRTGKRSIRRRSVRRRGTVAVEFAIVAIPLFLFIFVSIEFGRAMMAQSTMEEAARVGCRVSVIRGATPESVEAEISGLMRMAGIATYTVTIDPVDFTAAEEWEPIAVTVGAEFDDMSWLPVPQVLGGMSFSASCVLPKESSPEGT